MTFILAQVLSQPKKSKRRTSAPSKKTNFLCQLLAVESPTHPPPSSHQLSF